MASMTHTDATHDHYAATQIADRRRKLVTRRPVGPIQRLRARPASTTTLQPTPEVTIIQARVIVVVHLADIIQMHPREQVDAFENYPFARKFVRQRPI